VQFRARRQLVVDVGVALVVFALTLGLLAGGGIGESEADDRNLDALGGVLAALASLPLVARRRAPLAVFALTAAASAALSGLDYPHGPPLGPTVALYFLSVGSTEARARMWLTGATVAGFFVVHVGATGFAQDEFPTVPLLLGLVVWGGAWVAGDRVRRRRERMLELEERALRAEREAERERRLAAAEERTRIARDLHDSAGHAINVILVQAGAARLLSEKDPESARAALETIEEIARETVDEIDRLVGALRKDGSTAVAPDAVEPPPGLAALDALVDRHRAAGLDVTVHVRGERRLPTPGVDQAAYRILQEALTNAVRHGVGSAEVEVAYGPRALELTVSNPTRPGRAPAGPGHGIVGMRERAALLGGSLTAAGRDGLFRVEAELPYGAERP
jgi:signal transduction histidine kinase